MWESLICSAKDSHIFPTKNISVFVIFAFKILMKWAASWENQQPAYAKTETQISFAVTFVFATWIVQYLYFLNTKFQASIYLQWLHSLVSADLVKIHIVGFLALRLKY